MSIKTSKAPPRPRAGGRKSKRSKALRGRGQNKRKGRGAGRHHDQGPKTAVPRGVLVDLQDEVGDLAAILGCVPELQHFASTMEADRVNRANIRLSGKPLDVDPKSQRGMKMFTADLVDLGNAVDTIIAAVKWRLDRVKQLLAVMT